MITRIIWGLLLLASLYYFNIQIGVPTYYHSEIILPLIAGVLAAICLLQAICGFRSISDLSPYEDERDWRHPLIKFTPLAAIFFGIICYVVGGYRVDHLLETQGVNAWGQIQDGVSITGGRNPTSALTVRFTTKDGQDISQGITVDPGEFNRRYRGQEVMVRYYPGDPSICRMVKDNATTLGDTGEKSRRLEISDLEKLLTEVTNEDSVGARLNRINSRWTKDKHSESNLITWNNQANLWSVTVKPGVLVSVVMPLEELGNGNPFENAMYKKVPDFKDPDSMNLENGGHPGELYESNQYALFVKTARLYNDNTRNKDAQKEEDEDVIVKAFGMEGKLGVRVILRAK